LAPLSTITARKSSTLHTVETRMRQPVQLERVLRNRRRDSFTASVTGWPVVSRLRTAVVRPETAALPPEPHSRQRAKYELVGRFPIVLASLPTGGRLNRQPNEARWMADNGKPSSQRASADTILRIRDQPPANSSVHISGMPVVMGYHLGACKQTRRLRPRAVLCATGQNKHCF